MNNSQNFHNIKDTNPDRKTGDKGQHFTRVKFDFPCWEGSDPLSWAAQAERYFHFYNTSDYMTVEIASIHLDGDAIQ